MESIELSVVIPAFNEEKNLPVLIDRLRGVLQKMVRSYEIIIVDDGSTDRTLEVVSTARNSDQRIKIISLSRNFGHQAAINAGLEYVLGNAVVTMDADLQHPPEIIPSLYEQYVNGNDIVFTERQTNRQKGLLKRIFGTLFYWLLQSMSNGTIRPNVADFNLYSRPVLRALQQLPERDRFLRGLAQWVGFKKKYIQYEADVRLHGKSKYSIRKMFALATSGITSFTAFPLRLAWIWGGVISLSGFGYGLYIVFNYLFSPGHIVAGWTSLIILVLIIGGSQLLIIGLFGEYLLKVFYEVKGRPLYIIRNASGIQLKYEIKPNNQYGITPDM